MKCCSHRPWGPCSPPKGSELKYGGRGKGKQALPAMSLINTHHKGSSTSLPSADTQKQSWPREGSFFFTGAHSTKLNMALYTTQRLFFSQGACACFSTSALPGASQEETQALSTRLLIGGDTGPNSRERQRRHGGDRASVRAGGGCWLPTAGLQGPLITDGEPDFVC